MYRIPAERGDLHALVHRIGQVPVSKVSGGVALYRVRLHRKTHAAFAHPPAPYEE